MQSALIKRNFEWVIFLFLGATSLLMFFHTFDVYLGVDDFYFFGAAKNQGFTIPSFKEFFTRRYLNEVFSFTLAYRMFGERLGLYHLIGFIAHLGCGYGVFRLSNYLRPHARFLSIFAAAFFIVHPASYTIVAWIALCFNEPLALILTISGTMFFLRYLKKGELWSGLISLCLIPLASGFKNQAIIAPIFYGIFGYLAQKKFTDPMINSKILLHRAGLVLLPACGFSLWYTLAIVPNTAQFQHPAFARDWSLESLLNGYIKSLFSAVNPFAYFRESLGYQKAIPADFPPWTGTPWLSFRFIVISLVGGLSFFAALRQTQVLEWVLLTFLALVAMGFGAAMPHHQYEYYIYFALIPFSISISYLADLVPKRFLNLSMASSACFLVFISTFNGYTLPRTNRFIRQTENAKAGVEFARTLPPGSHLHFLKPNGNIIDDLVHGTAIHTMLPQMNLRVSFSGKEPLPFSTSSDRNYLIYFEESASGPGTFHIIKTLPVNFKDGDDIATISGMIPPKKTMK